ncbi:hypothetical protein PIB30_065723 [Stylosanthes scabra]|uniref:Uncharacterized protein n=1 Tax=Stylosanthes scabra TaxID=79078 RepID=A0ABU6QMW4_9FABA|nr:hypothetical protein [Stylosanthes scabra]
MIDGRFFDVFVKEFGSEVYSVQSHPDMEGDMMNAVSMEEDVSASIVKEMLVKIEKSPATKVDNGLIMGYVGDPQLEAIIDGRLNDIQSLNSCGDSGGFGNRSSCWRLRSTAHHLGLGLYSDERIGFVKLELMIYKAQVNKYINTVNVNELKETPLDSQGVLDSSSSCSCPYPIVFGPCSNQVQAHCDEIRVQSLLSKGVSVDVDTVAMPLIVAEGVVVARWLDDGVVVLGNEVPGELRDVEYSRDETRIADNGGVVAIPLASAYIAEKNDGVGFCENERSLCGVKEGSRGSEFLSVETLYRINDKYVDDSR